MMKNLDKVLQEIKKITSCRKNGEEIIFPFKTSTECIQKVIHFCRVPELYCWHLVFPKDIGEKEFDGAGTQIRLYWD